MSLFSLQRPKQGTRGVFFATSIDTVVSQILSLLVANGNNYQLSQYGSDRDEKG